MLDSIAVVLAILVTVAAAEVVRLALRRSLARPLHVPGSTVDETPSVVGGAALVGEPVSELAPEHAAA